MSTAQRVTPTVASDVIRDRLQLTGGEFGVLAAISALTFGCTQFAGGHLSDVFGATRVIKFAAILSAAGTLVFLLAPNYPIALLGRAVFGVADSAVFVGMMRFAVGARASGGALQIGKVQAAVTMGFAAAAAVGLGLNARTFPLLFGGLAVLQAAIALAIPAASSPPAVAAQSDVAIPGLAMVVGTRQFWASVAANVGLFAPFFAWSSGWAVPYLTAVGRLTSDQGRAVVILDSLLAMAAALSLGWLSDAIRRRRLLILGGALGMTDAWLGIAFVSAAGPAPTIMLSLIVAFAFPACNSSLVLAKESFPADRAGLVLGLSNTLSSVGAAVLGAAAGFGLDAGWRGAVEHGVRVYPAGAYLAVPVVMMLGSVLGLAGGIAARETYGRQRQLS